MPSAVAASEIVTKPFGESGTARAYRRRGPRLEGPRHPAGGELVWRRYAHVFDEARLAPAVGMVDAIEAARAQLAHAGLRPACSQAPVRVLRAARPA
jgi:hypothetical protein